MNPSDFRLWVEMVPAMSINPDQVNRDDVAMLASHLMECRRELGRLQGCVSPQDVTIIQAVLDGKAGI